MKRSKPASKSSLASRLWLESLDERVVPSRGSWLGIDLGILQAQIGIVGDSESDDDDDEHGKSKDEKESSGKSGKKDEDSTGNAYGRWASRVLGAVYYATNEVSNVPTSTQPQSSTITQAGSDVVNNTVAATEQIEESTIGEQEAVREIVQSTKLEIEKTPEKSADPANDVTARVDEIKTVRQADDQRIPPVQIDEPKSEHEDRAARPPLLLPTVERSTDAAMPSRGALESPSEIVAAGDDTSHKSEQKTGDSEGLVPESEFTGTFTLMGSGPSVAAVGAAPMIVTLEEATETMTPAVVQAAGAVSRFVPFDPASLQDSVQAFIESLRTKNLEEGSSFSIRRIALWTMGLLGGLLTGELARRKKVIKRSREWLSTNSLFGSKPSPKLK